MASIKALFDKEQAGFTVYSPDCTQSRLWGNLDQVIHQATGFQPIYRAWIYHDYNSIMRFYAAPDETVTDVENPQEMAQKYETIPAKDLKYGHLVVRLLLSAPSLMTIWQGENTVARLLALKGRTHPPQADKGTIRGSFWCDNGVCNLMHSSDDYSEMKRELSALRMDHIFEQDANPITLIEPIPAPTSYVAHSGIAVLCELVKRMQMTMNIKDRIRVQLPASGDARESYDYLSGLINDCASKMAGSDLADFVNAYLSGDVVAVTDKMQQLPITKWEHFVIQCGVMGMDKWKA